jgi:hypothetical protein
MRTSSAPATTRGSIRREGDTVEARILRRVGGGTPYFALEELAFDGAELRAVAPAETDPGAELGPVSAAELARHAVVAGLSAVALGRPDAARCYYLVSGIDATLFRSSLAFGARVRYSALASEQGPVGGAAQIEARIDETLVSRLRVSYAVIPETLFTRLFARHRTTTFGDFGSHKTYAPLESTGVDRHSAQARLVVPTSACRGHFDQHPALPVSTLLGQLVRLTSSLWDGEFRVSSLRMRSQAVAWAGDALDLRVTKSSGPWNFAGQASAAGRTVATVNLCLLPAEATRS